MKRLYSPFMLWKEIKAYLLSDTETLQRHSSFIRRMLDPNRLRSYCLEMAFFCGKDDLEVFFKALAADEVERRENPNDPDKEILFVNYTPQDNEDSEGWDEAEAKRHKEASRARWDRLR